MTNIIVSAVIFSFVVLTCAVAFPYLCDHQWFGDAYTRVNTDQKVVALTLDDGPNPPHTEDLLEVLERHQVRATFFLVGQQMDYYPGVAERILEHGHQLGNHSFTHAWLVFKSPKFIRRQITDTDMRLRDIGVEGEIPFRAPYGQQLFWLPYVLQQDGRTNYLFDVTPDDWSIQDPDVIVERVMKQTRAGSIIALHDGGGPRAGTVAAVDKLIPALKQNGYRFLTVTELVQFAGK